MGFNQILIRLWLEEGGLRQSGSGYSSRFRQRHQFFTFDTFRTLRNRHSLIIYECHLKGESTRQCNPYCASTILVRPFQSDTSSLFAAVNAIKGAASKRDSSLFPPCSLCDCPIQSRRWYQRREQHAGFRPIVFTH